MDPYQVRWTLFILCLKDYFGVNYTNCVWMCITLWLCSVFDILPGIKEDLEWKGSMYISVWIFVWFLYISVFVMYHFVRNTNLYYHANSFASNFPKYSCIQNLGTLELRLLLNFCFKSVFFYCKNHIILNHSQVNIVWVLLLVHVFDMLNLIDKCNYHEYVFIIIKNHKISWLVLVLEKKK